MASRIGARKDGSFKAVSTAPSFNKTPVGNSTSPLPYPTVADLSNSVSAVTSVRFNGDPAYVFDQTTQPICKGDDAGVCKGVKSGTVNGEVKPVSSSSTVRVGGKPVVRQGDACTMNGGNNPGIYVTTQVPSVRIEDGEPDGDTDPPISAQTPEEKSWFAKWWYKTKREVGQAVDQPWEGVKGALKGIANIPSDVGELLLKGATLQTAGDLQQAAAIQSRLGNAESSEAMMQAAEQTRANADSIELPKFAMSTDAQAGGDKIVTAATLISGGFGAVKTTIKGASGLSKAAAVVGAEAAKSAATASKVAQTESAVTESAKAVDAAGDAGKVAAESVSAGTSSTDGAKIIGRTKTLEAQGIGKAAIEGDKLLYRRGPRDSKALLESQSQSAEQVLGIHGVSVSASPAAKAGQVVRCASCSSVESAGFKIHKTGADVNHYTVELPKPITQDIVRTWNELFK